MIVKNKKGARIVRDVVATMAISNMYMDKEFILKLIKVADGEMSSDFAKLRSVWEQHTTIIGRLPSPWR